MYTSILFTLSFSLFIFLSLSCLSSFSCIFHFPHSSSFTSSLTSPSIHTSHLLHCTSVLPFCSSLSPSFHFLSLLLIRFRLPHVSCTVHSLLSLCLSTRCLPSTSLFLFLSLCLSFPLTVSPCTLPLLPPFLSR